MNKKQKKKIKEIRMMAEAMSVYTLPAFMSEISMRIWLENHGMWEQYLNDKEHHNAFAQVVSVAEEEIKKEAENIDRNIWRR